MKDTTLLYVTSFNEELYHATGHVLIRSFSRNNVFGNLICYHEDPVTQNDKDRNVEYVNITDCPELNEFFEKNKDVIPYYMGGDAPQCNCPDKFARKSNHLPGCNFTWWNRNAYRWFRKIIALRRAITTDATYLIWLDSDCYFKFGISNNILDLFKDCSVFYFQGKKRTFPETGIMGFNLLKQGRVFIEHFYDRYISGKFRSDERWDDCWQFMRTRKFSGIKDCKDLAAGSNNSNVIPETVLAKYIEHAKGTHGRILGIMK